MTQLTVQYTRNSEGIAFTRSDGQKFFLFSKNDGHAVLYAGDAEKGPPSVGLVDFDVSVADKLEAAYRWVLAYPNRPT